MPSIRLLLCVACLQNALYAQNLAPNPSFELYVECPSNFLLGEPLQAIPWSSGNTLSPDYYNACCDGCPVDVPDNGGGFQSAHTGNAYAGLYCRVVVDRREYLTAPLLSPLEAGTTYYVEFYVSPSEFACNTKPIGALFTVGAPVYNGELVLDDYTPQVQVNGDFIDDYEGWTLVSGCFVAAGGENQITLGNFLNDAQTPVNPDCHVETSSFDRSYYLIDDVLVESTPTEELDLDLGEAELACDFYTIDPGIPDVLYHWENGSGESTLTVTESGVYSLTISQGCNTGIDSIEVIIPVDVDVELPDETVNLCSPATYQINLDTGAGSYSWSDGTVGPSINISISGIYVVSLDNGCSVSMDTVEVIIQNAPEPFTLGDDFILCPDDEVTYTFDPEIGDFTWQNGQHSATYTIIQEGLYSLTITNECGTQTDEVEVTALVIPQVELGDPIQYICNGMPIFFSLDPDVGDYLWQDDTDEAEYVIHNAGEYYVFVTNECGADYDEILVEELSAPAPDLGSDRMICEGDTLTLNLNDETGVFVWQDQSTEPVYVLTQPGNYAVTVTNACGMGFDSMMVDFFPPLPVPDLGNDISLCPGESIVLHPGINNVTFSWQDLSIADTLLVNTAGTYSVTVSDQCSAYADTVNIIFQNDPPDIDLPGEVVLCQGTNITLEAGIAGVNYLWNDGSINDTLLVSTPGTYILTVSNACGIEADTVIVIDGGSLPEVSLGNDFSFCPGEAVLLSAEGQNINNLIWSNGTTGQSLEITESGIISVEAFNSCGVVTDTVIATLLPSSPVVELGADTSICLGDMIIIQPDIAGLSLVWSDGSEGEFLDISEPGIYFATFSGACGISSDTIVIGRLAPAPELDLGADRLLCPGDFITLHPDLPDVVYLWHDGSDNDTLKIAQPGQVTLTVSNLCGQASDTLLIIESTEGPKLDLGPDILACEGDTHTLITGITDVDFLWQDGTTNAFIEVSSSGQFILFVSNSCGEDRDTVNVNFNGTIPVPALGPDTILCEGETLTLLSNAPSGTDILWQDQSTLAQLIVSQPGLYTLHERNHCGEGLDSVFIEYKFAPAFFDLGRDTALCHGESILLTVPGTSDEILWQDGSGGSSFIANAGNVYSVIIANECGSRMDEIIVAENDNIIVLDLDNEYFLCPGDSILIDVTQDFEAEYLWNTGSIESSLGLIHPGSYTVSIFSPCHQVVGKINVLPEDYCAQKEIFIPNVFSPDNDGTNDLFVISPHPDLEIISIHGAIYDRWGNLLFESHGPGFSWDGMQKAQPVLQGVYVYQLELVYMNNGIQQLDLRVGDVTVIR